MTVDLSPGSCPGGDDHECDGAPLFDDAVLVEATVDRLGRCDLDVVWSRVIDDPDGRVYAHVDVDVLTRSEAGEWVLVHADEDADSVAAARYQIANGEGFCQATLVPAAAVDALRGVS